jgi:carbonic anhydrase
MDPVTARRLLLDGYTRFATARLEHPNQSDERRAAVAAATAPIAAILGCADARVPPEVIFDQGFGDLFVVRIAGAVVTDAVLGSIEVAVRDMAVPLLVVLGHTRCRALRIALDVIDGDGEAVGHTGALIDALIPAVERTAAVPGDRLDATIRASIRLSVEQLRTCEPILAPAVRAGALELAGWLYDVESGIVEMIA